VAVLPLLALSLFGELGWWAAATDDGQLFDGGSVSNRQLQVSMAIGCLAAFGFAWRTRTVALASLFTVGVALLALSLLADLGLRTWLDDGRWDLLALHIAPLIAIYATLGRLLEGRDRRWFARPLYVGGAALLVTALELLALDGRLLGHLGLTLHSLSPSEVSDPTLLDTALAMSVNGLLFYLVATLLERRGSATMRPAATTLAVLSPFALLQPIAWLNQTGEYTQALLWLHLAAAVAVAARSCRHQRRSFYYAGVLNTGLAIGLLTDRYQWFDVPSWSVAVVAGGVAALATGWVLHLREERARSHNVA